jgi:hypothetical protein
MPNDDARARHNARPRALFPTLNKQNDIDDYRRGLASGEYLTQPIEVVETVNLGAGDYDEFTSSLMTRRGWLAGKGGVATDAPGLEDVSPWQLDESERRRWISMRYLHVIAVAAPGRPTIYVDPQGYDYARYVGFPSPAPPTDA